MQCQLQLLLDGCGRVDANLLRSCCCCRRLAVTLSPRASRLAPATVPAVFCCYEAIAPAAAAAIAAATAAVAAPVVRALRNEVHKVDGWLVKQVPRQCSCQCKRTDSQQQQQHGGDGITLRQLNMAAPHRQDQEVLTQDW
jgi:hypothetical protein